MFIEFPESLIQVGKSIKKEIFFIFNNNINDLRDRVNTLEVSAGNVEVVKFFVLNASSFQSATGLYYYEFDRPITITNAYIRIFEKGSLSGTIEIDVKKSTSNLDNPAFSTIFTTKPSINLASAANYQASTNQVFDSSKISFQPGDFLRLDITQAPTTGVLPKLLISVYGE
jgi:hypothetical protein